MPIVSTQSLRHFAAAVVSIMSAGGLEINGVSVIGTHRACRTHALGELQYRDVLRRAFAEWIPAANAEDTVELEAALSSATSDAETTRSALASTEAEAASRSECD